RQTRFIGLFERNLVNLFVGFRAGGEFFFACFGALIVLLFLLEPLGFVHRKALLSDGFLIALDFLSHISPVGIRGQSSVGPALELRQIGLDAIHLFVLGALDGVPRERILQRAFAH